MSCTKKSLRKNNKAKIQKKEAENMAVFSKPANFSFQVAESKTEAFIKKDTRSVCKQSMEKFKIHGVKITPIKRLNQNIHMSKK